MSDLQEIRRFWPWMPPPHVDTDGYHTYTAERRGVRYLVHQHQAQWWLSVCNSGSRSWSEVFVDEDGYRIGGGDTIAAAMAAAGFAEREKGFFAEYNQVDTAVWLRVTKRHADKYAGRTRIPPQSRQRPRKGVRLGKRGRRLAFAASIAEALEMIKSSWPRYSDKKRLDRGEIGR